MIELLLRKEVRNKKGLVKGNPFWVSFLDIYTCSLAEVCCYIVVSIILRYLIITMGSIWSGGYFSIKWQRCWSKNSISVADSGEGLTLPRPLPLIFRPNWGSKGPRPPSPLWRSGSATELTPLNLNCRLVSVSLVPLKLASMVIPTFQVHSMFIGNQSLRVRLMKERQWGYIPNRLFAA